eukprot:208572-Hanusia_phi.AAC.3
MEQGRSGESAVPTLKSALRIVLSPCLGVLLSVKGREKERLFFTWMIVRVHTIDFVFEDDGNRDDKIRWGQRVRLFPCFRDKVSPLSTRLISIAVFFLLLPVIGKTFLLQLGTPAPAIRLLPPRLIVLTAQGRNETH